MVLLFFLLLCLGFYYRYRWLITQYESVHSSDEQIFENFRFSTQAFYNLVENGLDEKQIPGLKTGRVHYKMKGMFSRKREYFRITYLNYVFDVCAAPFVQDFFVSWRQGTLRQLSLFRRSRAKTFYEMDTEAIFFSTVKRCIDRAVTTMKEMHGERKQLSSDPSSL